MTAEIIKSPFCILFVDDEDIARKYFEKGLKGEFNILTAANVDEATKILEENHRNIAVVITDQRMPGGNGVKLLRFLRENHPQIIRFLTTAYSDLTEAIDAVNSGEIFRYVQKPWDYTLLKVELRQAIALFELRLDHSKLLQEKIMIRKKMSRIERAKSLLIAARGFDFLRFSDLAVQNFIQNFATSPAENNTEDDWESFDFGRSDVLETKFFINLIDKVHVALSSKQDYSFNDNIDATKLTSLIEAKKLATIQMQISGAAEAQVNLWSLAEIISRLMQMAKSGNSGSINAEKISNALVIKLHLTEFNLSEARNIFIQNPDKPAEDFYLNLLICYLLTWHHGGFIECKNSGASFSCIVKLPDNPVHPIFSNPQSDSLENTILTTMIC